MKSEKIGRFGSVFYGDCLDILKTLPSNSITSIISDPPAGISFMNSTWDEDKGGRTEWINWLSEIMKECLRVIKPGGMIAIWAIPRTSHWTMTAIEDAGFTIRSKFYHIFGSGFPKSSSIPKSIDRKLGKKRKVVGKRGHPTLVDKSKVDRQNSTQYHAENSIADEWELTESNSDEAKLFDGYGTATKPSTEEWILAMAPLDGTYVENALKHGLAGINVDASRIGTTVETWPKSRSYSASDVDGHGSFRPGGKGKIQQTQNAPKGRWPADLILSHHPECVLVGNKKVKGIQTTNYGKHKTQPGASGTMNDGWNGDKLVQGYADKDGNETIEDWECHPQCPIRIIGEQSGVKKSGFMKAGHPYGQGDGQNVYGKLTGYTQTDTHGDKGTAARFFLNLPSDPGFFYCAKSSRSERNHGCENLQSKFAPTMGNGIGGKEHDPITATYKNNHHSTVKPLSLMKYLVKLLAPPQNPVILDMFAGSGTTGVACEQLKIPFILIEKEAEYCDIIRARVNAANEPIQKTPTKIIKQKIKGLLDLSNIDLTTCGGE